MTNFITWQISLSNKAIFYIPDIFDYGLWINTYISVTCLVSCFKIGKNSNSWRRKIAIHKSTLVKRYAYDMSIYFQGHVWDELFIFIFKKGMRWVINKKNLTSHLFKNSRVQLIILTSSSNMYILSYELNLVGKDNT